MASRCVNMASRSANVFAVTIAFVKKAHTAMAIRPTSPTLVGSARNFSSTASGLWCQGERGAQQPARVRRPRSVFDVRQQRFQGVNVRLKLVQPREKRDEVEVDAAV